MHRDLKPDKIIISINPLDVKLIDFNRSYLRTVSTMGTLRVTEGYFPDVSYLKDGITKWYFYDLGAIIFSATWKNTHIMMLSHTKKLGKLSISTWRI